MPRLLDPAASIDVVLQSDKAKPADQQPTFHVRVLSKRDWLEFGRRYDETFDGTADGESDDQKLAAEGRLDKRYELAHWVLRGWSRMTNNEGHALPFDETAMDDVLDPWELMELLDQALAGGRLNCEQKKT